MMKNIFLCLPLLFILLDTAAQKTVYDENVALRDVKGFHAIEVSSGVDLYISAGEEAVAVSASDAKYRDKITTTVTNGVLHISYSWEKGWLSGAKSLKAYVSFKKLTEVAASGGSDIFVTDVISQPSLKIQLSGGSDFRGKVALDELTVAQSGGSDVKISGTVYKITVAASGGSDFDGYGLAAEVCDLSASGASDINITASKEITAAASGASDIKWKGTAEIKSAKASGSSNVKKS